MFCSLEFCPPESQPEYVEEYGWNLDWYNEYEHYIGLPNAYGIPCPIEDYNNLREINKNNRKYAKSKVFGLKEDKLQIKEHELKIIEPVPKEINTLLHVLPADAVIYIKSYFYTIGENNYTWENGPFLGTYVETTTTTIEQYKEGFYFTHIFEYTDKDKKEKRTSVLSIFSELEYKNRSCFAGCCMSGGKKYKKYKSKKNKKKYKNIRKSIKNKHR